MPLPRLKRLLAAVFMMAFFVLIAAGTCLAGDYASSSHYSNVSRADLSTAGYATGNCAHCHEQHASLGGDEPSPDNTRPDSYLLFEREETMCNYCHGHGAEGGDTTYNIETELDKGGGGSSHDLTIALGVHDPEETRAELSATKHVECTDCHNPHVAQSGIAVGNRTNLAPSVMLGAPAVEPSWGSEWNSASGYSEGQIATSGTYKYEWQVCFRCHSGYNTNVTTATWSTSWTDTAIEFNPANASFHPVTGDASYTTPNSNRNTATAGSGSGQHGPVFTGSWTSSSMMQCSDCHSDETAARPNGPHGSNNSAILTGPYDSQTGWHDPANQGGWGVHDSSGDLCFDCHDINAYATCDDIGNCTNYGSYHTGFSDSTETDNTQKRFNLHTYHVADKGYSCTSCHVLRIHGARTGLAGEPANIDKGLLIWDDKDTPTPYKGGMTMQGTSYLATDTSTNSRWLRINTWQSSGSWSAEADCSYVTGAGGAGH